MSAIFFNGTKYSGGGGGLQVGTMTYIGDGKSGAENPKVLTFPRKPDLVWIHGHYLTGTREEYSEARLMQGQDTAIYHGLGGTSHTTAYPRKLFLEWSDDGKTVSFHAGTQSASAMLNAEGYEYTVKYI